MMRGIKSSLLLLVKMKHKLVYIADIRLPTEKAHGIQIMEMCSAFADLGLAVTLYVPKRHTPITTDPFEYYEVKRNFTIHRLFCIDLTNFGSIGFTVQRLSFTKMALLKSLFQKNTIFYTRDSLIAFGLTFFGKEVVWEGHQGEINIVVRVLLRCHTKMVVISHALKNLYVSLGAVPENILVSSDAVDIHKFSLQVTKEEARKKRRNLRLNYRAQRTEAIESPR